MTQNLQPTGVSETGPVNNDSLSPTDDINRIDQNLRSVDSAVLNPDETEEISVPGSESPISASVPGSISDLGIGVSDDDLEEQWKRSSIRKSTLQWIKWVVPICLLLQFIVWGLCGFVWSHREFGTIDEQVAWQNSSDRQWVYLWLILILGGLVFDFFLYRLALKSIKDQRTEFIDNTRLKHAASLISSTSALDYESLWGANKAYIHIYHSLVRDYAMASRRATLASLGAAFVGVGAIAVLALTLSHANPLTGSIATAAGALLTGFVARTMLRNSETSSEEVRRSILTPWKLNGR